MIDKIHKIHYMIYLLLLTSTLNVNNRVNSIIENNFDIEYLSFSNIKSNLENNLFIENKIIKHQGRIFDKLNKK